MIHLHLQTDAKDVEASGWGEADRQVQPRERSGITEIILLRICFIVNCMLKITKNNFTVLGRL